MLALKVILLLLAGGTNCILALLVLLRDPKKLNAISFTLLSLSIGGWGLGIAGFLLTHDPGLALVWAKIYYLFPLLIAFSIIYFAGSFPDRHRESVPIFWRWFATLGLFVNAVPLLINQHYLTADVTYDTWGKGVILQGSAYGLYAFYLLVCFVGALYIIFKRIDALKGVYAEQARLFFAGFLTASAFGVAFNLILPGFGNYRLIWLGPLFTAVLSIAIAVSIVRHRMFDIRLFAVRAAAYLFSVGLISLFYIAPAVIIVAHFVHVQVSSAMLVWLIITSLLLTVVYRYLRLLFDKWTNRIFFRGYYEPQDVLNHLSDLLVRSIDVEYLQLKSQDILAQALHIKHFFYCLSDSEPERCERLARLFRAYKDLNVLVLDDVPNKTEAIHALQQENVAAIVRLRTTRGNLGFITLGFKESGSPFTERDKRLLSIAADEIAISLQNALHFSEIQNFNRTLQERVEHATKELRNTNTKLRTLDETKDDFISMASHQLRTPLTSVKGYLSLVLEGDAGTITEQQRKLLTQAYVSSQRMVYLISDLLNVSRLKTGKFIIERTPVNMAELISDELSQLEETAAARSVVLIYNKPHDFPTLMLDETKIRQVIMNFVDNAIYYTPSGGHIDVELLNKASLVELRVIDNGIGVPKSEQHHLFTKFYRAQNARQARPDGTGLGLFMAKKVVATLGGAIIFESQEGKGSTFGFSFNKAKLTPKDTTAAEAGEAVTTKA